MKEKKRKNQKIKGTVQPCSNKSGFFGGRNRARRKGTKQLHDSHAAAQPQVVNRSDSLGASDLWTASCAPRSPGAGCQSPRAADRQRVRQALFVIRSIRDFLKLL